MRCAPRLGVTLLELIVALVLLGLLAGAAALSLRTRTLPGSHPATSPLRSLRSDRARAMHDGVIVTGMITWDLLAYDYSVLPNGVLVTEAPVPRESLAVSLRSAE
jgi:prepilin-type N-terminal cleavage/methylation domain-containing protein